VARSRARAKSRRIRHYEQFAAAYTDTAAERAKAEAAALAAVHMAALEQAAADRRPKLYPRGTPGLRTPDSEIIEIVRNLAQIQCTTVEAGLVFGASAAEFREWLRDHPEAGAAWENGRGQGLISLRRAQFESALSGNSTMLVWLGKQYLDQQDRILHAGDSAQPIIVQWQLPQPQNRE
jgi:hypothetical protein